MAEISDSEPSIKDDIVPVNKKITSPNSKNVITINKAIVQDTTILNDDKEEDEPKAEQLNHKIVIAPISGVELNVSKEENKDEAPTKVPETIPTKEPNDLEDSNLVNDNKTNLEKVPDQLSDDAKKKNEADDKASLNKKYDSLIESKKYFLPINVVAKKKTKKFLILSLILIILLILVWIDISLDAGIIKLGGIKPITHFFK